MDGCTKCAVGACVLCAAFTSAAVTYEMQACSPHQKSDMIACDQTWSCDRTWSHSMRRDCSQSNMVTCDQTSLPAIGHDCIQLGMVACDRTRLHAIGHDYMRSEMWISHALPAGCTRRWRKLCQMPAFHMRWKLLAQMATSALTSSPSSKVET